MCKRLNTCIKLLHLMGAAQVLSCIFPVEFVLYSDSRVVLRRRLLTASMDRRNADTIQCT